MMVFDDIRMMCDGCCDESMERDESCVKMIKFSPRALLGGSSARCDPPKVNRALVFVGNN